MKNYFSISQVAEKCSVNRSTVNRWVASGKIKSYHTPGGHNRILIEDLQLFLEQNHMPIVLDAVGKKNRRILIVDDDITTQEYLTDLLNGIFTEVEIASDGFEAGIKIMEFQPHLIILDLFMPKVDGFQVCKTIKENPSTNKIKVLIMSGHDTQENKDNAMSSGADAFLSKPSSMKVIVRQIENLLK
jgi:excisionase family DNA binding protein